MTNKQIAWVLTLLSCLHGCGSSDDSSSSSSNNSDSSDNSAGSSTNISAFPNDLAVASPTDNSSISSSFMASLMARVTAKSTSGSSATAYAQAVDRINEILNGDTPVTDIFTPELFYSRSTDASCYGPKLFYQNHIDGSDGTPQDSDLYPSLPTGDLGLWKETEGETNEACAAAELNARIAGLRDRSFIALMSVASTVRTYIDAGYSWPGSISAGTTVTLTIEMNALGITDTTFSNVTISLDSTGTIWTYDINFSYTRDSNTYNINVDLTHIPGASDNEYEGLLTYLADDTFDPPGNCSSTDVTINGSLHYIRNSETDMRLQSRSAQFCGHGTNGITVSVPTKTSSTLTGNVVNPEESWGNNFDIFTAEYNPSDLGGHYVYAWQAGKHDSHSRILHVGLEAVSSGESYFGYGDTLSSTNDGINNVEGLICNWAGPNGSHVLADYAQRQHITLNTTSNLYEPTNSGASDITYAPVNGCNYDGSGGFLYDRDLDGDLLDEAVGTAAVTVDLMEPSGSAANIWEHITSNRGYDLPAYPE